MKFFLISDFLPDEVVGGCEINNAELAIELRNMGHSVVEKKSVFLDTDFVIDNEDACFIVSNFINLSETVKEELKKASYVIYEHDHKYIRTRNPAQYENFKAPKADIINLSFYQNAAAVFCQSNFHMQIIKENTGLNNLFNLSGNLWSTDSLDIMEKLSREKKSSRVSILNSPVHHKNTIDAIRYCQYKKRDYDLVSSNNYYSFLEMLGKNEEFVFFPKTPETLSRVVCEARMMNMVVTANNLIGATSEPWFSLKGESLIARMRDHRKTIATNVVEAFQNVRKYSF